MSAETAAAISAIDLADLSLPPDRAHHALLIGRDAHGIDERLRRHLSDAGAKVTVAATGDYGQMMTFSDTSKAPRESIERSLSWLNERAAPSDESASPMDSEFVTDVISFDYDGCTITERQIQLDSPSGRLVEFSRSPRLARELHSASSQSTAEHCGARVLAACGRNSAGDAQPAGYPRFDSISTASAIQRANT